MLREVIAMKHLLAIFLIGVSCFLFACSDDAKKHINRGNNYQQQGKYDLAIASYQKAIDINPDYADAHYNWGTVVLVVLYM